MLYSFTKQDKLLILPAIDGLVINEVDDPELMAFLGQIPLEEAVQRLANDHKAYVGHLHGRPAAFGWMATGKAKIGELNHEFILPLNHRYLWNFRTLSDFRGLGIYPHLLQFIILNERHKADCFWIMHAPENKASQRGIGKVGFRYMGQVSVIGREGVIFQKETSLNDVLQTFGFIASNTEQPSCWNCSSPFMKNRKMECCCLSDDLECKHSLFKEVDVKIQTSLPKSV